MKLLAKIAVNVVFAPVYAAFGILCVICLFTEWSSGRSKLPYAPDFADDLNDLCL